MMIHKAIVFLFILCSVALLSSSSSAQSTESDYAIPLGLGLAASSFASLGVFVANSALLNAGKPNKKTGAMGVVLGGAIIFFAFAVDAQDDVNIEPGSWAGLCGLAGLSVGFGTWAMRASEANEHMTERPMWHVTPVVRAVEADSGLGAQLTLTF